MLRSGHHEDRFQLRKQLAIDLRHLKLILEIADSTQAAYNNVNIMALAEIDQ